MVWRDNIKILGIKAKASPLLISMLLHMVVLFVFTVVNNEKKRVFTVELVMKESMSGSTKTFAKCILDKKSGFSKNNVKGGHKAEPALYAPEAKNTDNQKSEELPMTESPSFFKSENIQSSHRGVNRNEGTTLASGISVETMSDFHDKTGNGSYSAKGDISGKDIVESEFGSINGPSFLRMIKPDYPKLARKLGKEGKVVLRLFIDEQGKLVSVELIEKAGYGFDEAAIEAVKASTFRPAKLNGVTVACKAILPVRFKLSKEE